MGIFLGNFLKKTVGLTFGETQVKTSRKPSKLYLGTLLEFIRVILGCTFVINNGDTKRKNPGETQDQ